MIMSIDTETTGLDLYHGAAPFMVGTLTEDNVQRIWEWDVDPLTRKVAVDPGEMDDVVSVVRDSERLVGQNVKFDVTALGVHRPDLAADWPWDRTECTLTAAHVLHSNQPKNLNALSVTWLGRNPEAVEDELKKAVKACRTYCRFNLPDWAVAKKGRPDMPSAGEEDWRADYWLPKAATLAVPGHFPESYATVTTDYLESDIGGTLAVWLVIEAELNRRGLWKIYRERMKAVRVMVGMERRGVTVSAARIGGLCLQYADESAAASARCADIATGYGYELNLPKSGRNKSLDTFVWDVMGLDKVYSPKSKTGNPTFDKSAIEHYIGVYDKDEKGYTGGVLKAGSREEEFVKTLTGKRARDTACSYMLSYQRFWRPVGGRLKNYYRLHPNLNPTGTDTTRQSSSCPNEQNISKREGFNLRFGFGPAPGREWWSMDGKNLELRLPFYRCGQKELIELFETPDAPPYYGSNHLANAHAVFPEVWESLEREVGFDRVGKEFKKRYESTYYRLTKSGGFAKQYGGQRRKVDSTFGRAGAFDLLEEKFDKLSAFTQECIRFANKHGYVETFPDATVDPLRGYPLLVNRSERGGVEPTKPLSYVIQGSAGWWMGKAMVRCDPVLYEWRRADDFDAFMCMQVHDELVFDFPRGADPRVNRRKSNLGRARVLQREIEKGGHLDYNIPTPVGVEYHPENWSAGIAF